MIKKFVLLMAVVLVLLAAGYGLGLTPLTQAVMPDPGYFQAQAAASPTPAEPEAMGAMEEVVRFSRFEFYGDDEQGVWGTVWQVKVEGETVLRFAEDFRAGDGSVLEVILVEDAEPTRQEVAEGYRLADLKAVEGVQEYEIATDIDLDAYRTVAIYDRDADIVLATAELPEVLPEPAPTPIYSKGELVHMDPAEVGETGLPIDPVEDINRTGHPPEIDIEEYRLVVDGAVETPLSLSYQDILAYPEQTDVVLLICPGFFVDNAQWSGVPVSLILEEANLKPEAEQVRFHAGSYRITLTLEEARRAGTYLAHHVNGQVLPEKDGFPLRLVVEGKYGNQWVKWVERIEVLE